MSNERGFSVGPVNYEKPDAFHGRSCSHVYYPTLQEAIDAERAMLVRNIASSKDDVGRRTLALSDFDKWVKGFEV